MVQGVGAKSSQLGLVILGLCILDLLASEASNNVGWTDRVGCQA